MLPTVPPGTVVHNNFEGDRFLDKAAVFIDSLMQPPSLFLSAIL